MRDSLQVPPGQIQQKEPTSPVQKPCLQKAHRFHEITMILVVRVARIQRKTSQNWGIFQGGEGCSVPNRGPRMHHKTPGF